MLINFKKFLPCFILFLGLFSITPAFAIDLPNNIEYQETKLTLNGHELFESFHSKLSISYYRYKLSKKHLPPSELFIMITLLIN